MGPDGREGDDALDRVFTRREAGHGRAGDPLKRVDAVDRLVHQRPTTVEGLGALPAAGAVVGVVPPPGHIARGDRQLAEPTRRGRRLHRGDHGVESLRKDRPQRHAPAVGRGDHPVDPLEGDLERLLADHRHAAADRGQGRVEMGARGRGDGDEVGLLAAEHRRGVGVPRAVELTGEGPALLFRATRGRHERDARNVGQRLGVEPGDRADADDGRPHRLLAPQVHPPAAGPRMASPGGDQSDAASGGRQAARAILQATAPARGRPRFQ